jgi:class 3 adenylate cyclase
VVACAAVLGLHQTKLFDQAASAWGQWVSTWLQGAAVQKVPALWQYAYHTLTAFLAATICAGIRVRYQGILFILGWCFLTATLSLALAVRGWSFEPLSGCLAAMLGGVGGLWIAARGTGSQVLAFRDFFVGRLTEETFDQLIVNGEPARLTGQREITTVTCRVMNAYDLSLRLEAAAMEQLLSAFQKEVGDLLVAQGGYLDVSNAHEITAHFGFPLRSVDHARQACAAALQAKKVVADLEALAQKRWEQLPAWGMGVASGQVVCGLLGHGQFQAYSLLGKAVETSRRLCDSNAIFGSRLLLTHATLEAAREHIEVRPMEKLQAEDSEEPYELLGLSGTLTDEEKGARDAFWEGMVALRSGEYSTARDKLRAAVIIGRHDKPLKHFLAKAEAAKTRSTRKKSDV